MTSSNAIPQSISNVRARPIEIAIPAVADISTDNIISIVFGVLWLVFMTPMTIGFFNASQQLERAVITVGATVTNREIKTNSEDKANYYVTYQYEAQGPRGKVLQITNREKVFESTYQSTTLNGPLTIIYAASNPDLSRIEQEYTSFSLFCFIPFVLFGLLFILVPLRHLPRARELDRDGRLTLGKIIRCWKKEKPDKGGSSYDYYVTYEFEDGFKARQKVAPPDYEKLSPGEAVTIRYLPRDPKFSRMELSINPAKRQSIFQKVPEDNARSGRL